MLSLYTPGMERVVTKSGFDNSTKQMPHSKCPYWALLLSAK